MNDSNVIEFPSGRVVPVAQESEIAQRLRVGDEVRAFCISLQLSPRDTDEAVDTALGTFLFGMSAHVAITAGKQRARELKRRAFWPKPDGDGPRAA